MGLKEDVDLGELSLPGGVERRADFCRVVAVVVDDGDPGGFTLELEATVDALEGSEACGNY